MFKQCVICGNEFDAKGNSKTCSDKCRFTLAKKTQYICCKNWKANNHEKSLEINRKSKHKNCEKYKAQSKVKNQEMYRRNRAKILIRIKLKRIGEGKKVKPFCCICGKTFEPKFCHEHFCSDECREQSPLWRLYTSYPTTFSKFFGKILGE